MMTRTTNQAIRLLLVLLLVVSVPSFGQTDPPAEPERAVEGAAKEPTSRITLHLDQALTLGRTQTVPAPAANGIASARNPLTEPRTLERPDAIAPLMALAPAPSYQEERALKDAAGGKTRRFGRWLKKHWYVPVLVGVAIGVAVSDDGSDGPNDIED